MSSVNNDKLAKLQAQALSASGPRRKVKKAHKTVGGDDKKLQASLKKLNAQNVPGIEEINMFQEDGNVIHFKVPKGKALQAKEIINLMRFVVQAAINANTFAITGEGEEKELTELVPGILSQLGPDSLASLRKIAEAYQAHSSAKGTEEIPDLVDNFEAASLEDEKASA